jgi:hypothetical protein
MSRTFQDHDFMVWEAYPSSGPHGESEQAHLVFNCLTSRAVKPRYLVAGGDQADVERRVVEADEAELRAMLGRAIEIM